MYDYVTPDKVVKALTWLKANNPLYADVPINLQWVDQARNENIELFNGLTGEVVCINASRDVITEYDMHYNILVDWQTKAIF